MLSNARGTFFAQRLCPTNVAVDIAKANPAMIYLLRPDMPCNYTDRAGIDGREDHGNNKKRVPAKPTAAIASVPNRPIP